MRPTLAALMLVFLCVSQASARDRTHYLPHPAGCPETSFCGCGVSVRVFGHPVRELYLAANWRRFPSAEPASGMVAWRWGHVFYIVKMIGRGKVIAYDPNSGGHRTRIHVRALAGYRIVNPHRQSASL